MGGGPWFRQRSSFCPQPRLPPLHCCRLLCDGRAEAVEAPRQRATRSLHAVCPLATLLHLFLLCLGGPINNEMTLIDARRSNCCECIRYVTASAQCVNPRYHPLACSNAPGSCSCMSVLCSFRKRRKWLKTFSKADTVAAFSACRVAGLKKPLACFALQQITDLQQGLHALGEVGQRLQTGSEASERLGPC